MLPYHPWDEHGDGLQAFAQCVGRLPFRFLPPVHECQLTVRWLRMYACPVQDGVLDLPGEWAGQEQVLDSNVETCLSTN